MQRKLDKLLKPQTIAIIGASNKKGSVGYAVMHNMLNAGYEGVVYPVHPKAPAIQGVKAYPTVDAIPETVDLGVICTPAPTVPPLVEACGRAGFGGLVIISAGFAEAGEEGKRMYNQILDVSRGYGMRIIGPNCLGVINPHLGINASFAAKMALPGKLALISQSGALLTSILDWSVDQQVGFSHFVSIGSMIDVDFADLIDYFGTDPQTSCILIYMESMKNPRRFMSAARAFSRNKPIVVIKAGRSAEGGKAAMSHTGSMAGNDAVFDAAFQRAGIIRVDTIAQLFNMAQTVAMQPRPGGNRLAIVTNAGGPGVLATDYLMREKGQLAKLSEETLNKLDAFMPSAWSHGNPLDVLGDADEKRYQKAIEACVQDEGVDGVLVILTPQSMTNPEAIAKAVVSIAQKTQKPILTSWMGEMDVDAGRSILEAGQVPNYRFPESGVDVFLRLARYTQDLALLYETPSETPEDFSPDREGARKLLEEVYQAGRSVLTETEAKRLLDCYHIDVSKNKVCPDVEQALAFAEEVGYPVVLKIASPDILHKTDAGGVKLNIRTPEELRATFAQILENAKAFKADARIDGVLVERMVRKGHELLLGAVKDPIFGPVVLFGRGGVTTEVFKDTRMGLPPLNMALAKRIIERTQIYTILKGYRGMPGVNLEELAFLLIKFSYLVMDFPQIREVDINPYVVDEKGGVALDARVGLDPDLADFSSRPYQHLVISPYPGETYSREVTLKDGRKVLFRPIRPEDEPALEAMLSDVSDETLYMRFFGYIPVVTHNWMTRFTHIDYDREMAIIAETEYKGKPILMGVVRIIEDAWRETAEYSILVADKWQGLGLGNLLTDYIIELAKSREIKKLEASVLPGNENMIHIFEKRGFRIDRSDREIFEVEKAL